MLIDYWRQAGQDGTLRAQASSPHQYFFQHFKVLVEGEWLKDPLGRIKVLAKRLSLVLRRNEFFVRSEAYPTTKSMDPKRKFWVCDFDG